jgi:hypothetical protein
MSRDAKGRFIKRTAPSTSVPAVNHLPSVGNNFPPTFSSSLPYFAALLLAAVAWYYAAPFVVLAPIIISPFLLLAWLEPGYPRTAFIFYGFLSGLISGIFGSRGYYRRRWW